jgi:hypothetical protein
MRYSIEHLFWCALHVRRNCLRQAWINIPSDDDLADTAKTSERVQYGCCKFCCVDIVQMIDDVNLQLLQTVLVHQERGQVQRAALREATSTTHGSISVDVDGELQRLNAPEPVRNGFHAVKDAREPHIVAFGYGGVNSGEALSIMNPTAIHVDCEEA